MCFRNSGVLLNEAACCSAVVTDSANVNWDRKMLTQLFTDLGPLLDEVAIREDAAGEAWHIFFSEEFDLVAEYDGFRNRLILRSELGTPPPDRKIQIYELLLATNTMWKDTGGITFGISPQDGEVLLSFDLSAEGLQVDQLHNLVLGFVDKALTWRQLVQSGGISGDRGPPEGLPMGAMRA